MVQRGGPLGRHDYDGIELLDNQWPRSKPLRDMTLVSGPPYCGPKKTSRVPCFGFRRDCFMKSAGGAGTVVEKPVAIQNWSQKLCYCIRHGIGAILQSELETGPASTMPSDFASEDWLVL